MLYRFADPKDLREVLELNKELLAEQGYGSLLSDAEMKNRLAAWLLEGHKLLLFECDQTLIGYALYLVNDRGTGEEIVYLRHFIIHLPHRRKGLGRAAMTHLLDSVWPPEAMVCVDTRENNCAAIALWQSVGFKIYSHTFARKPPSRSI